MFSKINLNQIVVMIVPLLFTITIHEIAHGYVALRLGNHTAQKAGRLTLNPMKHLNLFGSLLLPLILKLTGPPVIFGYAKPAPVNFSSLKDIRKSTIYDASTGISANFILAVLSGILFQILNHCKLVWHTSILAFYDGSLFYTLLQSYNQFGASHI